METLVFQAKSELNSSARDQICYGYRCQLDAGFWILDVEYSDHSSIQLFIEYQVSSIEYPAISPLRGGSKPGILDLDLYLFTAIDL